MAAASSAEVKKNIKGYGTRLYGAAVSIGRAARRQDYACF